MFVYISLANTCPCKHWSLSRPVLVRERCIFFRKSGRSGKSCIPNALRQALQASPFLKRHQAPAESAKGQGRLLDACQPCQIVFQLWPSCSKPYAKFLLGNDHLDLTAKLLIKANAQPSPAIQPDREDARKASMGVCRCRRVADACVKSCPCEKNALPAWQFRS